MNECVIVWMGYWMDGLTNRKMSDIVIYLVLVKKLMKEIFKGCFLSLGIWKIFFFKNMYIIVFYY